MGSELDPEVLESLRSWWCGIWELELEDIAAGKDIKMVNPALVSALRGPDLRLSHLYVRKGFEALYEEILRESEFAVNDFLCHLNGNSGVGKSAFLWYFIIRSALLCKSMPQMPQMLHILYESAGYIWEFKGKSVDVTKRDNVTAATFNKAIWHLINQAVPSVGAIGPVVLVAASPAKGNVKAAKADRKKTVMYMYPWEAAEFQDLVKLWKRHYDELADQRKVLEDKLGSLKEWAKQKIVFDDRWMSVLVARADFSGIAKVEAQVEKLLKRDYHEGLLQEASYLTFTLQVLVKALGSQVQDGVARVRAASEYFDWFGGVVRLLWSDNYKKLNLEGYEEFVKEKFARTDLVQLLYTLQTASQGDDISWAVLHFLQAESNTFRKCYIDFCSARVRALFTAALTRMKALELQMFMESASEVPQFGALRGFVFEELAIAHVLHGAPSMMTPMADDKHCKKCSRRGDPSRGINEGKWIHCDMCENWYHFGCARVTKKQELQVRWECPSCEGKQREEPLQPRRLLRYYEGDLKTALLSAGPDAIQYAWRPVKKNNGAVDFTILPNILAQPTIAGRHLVAVEALQTHMDALCAWNNLYGTQLTEVVLCFLLAESNYDKFGFQSYRNKARRVTQQAVKGIRQCKVLLRHDIPVPCVEQVEIPKDVDVVDDIQLCNFGDEVCEASYFDPEMQFERHEEVMINKKRKLAF